MLQQGSRGGGYCCAQGGPHRQLFLTSEAEEEANDVRKVGHMGNFYANLLTKNVALGTAAPPPKPKEAETSPAQAQAGAEAQDAETPAPPRTHRQEQKCRCKAEQWHGGSRVRRSLRDQTQNIRGWRAIVAWMLSFAVTLCHLSMRYDTWAYVLCRHFVRLQDKV
eukprot:637869-Pelagomonas_calceolata.AAC.4